MHPKAQENMSKLLECAHQISAQFKCGVFHEFSQQSLRGSSKFAARVCNDNTATTQLDSFPGCRRTFLVQPGNEATTQLEYTTHSGWCSTLNTLKGRTSTWVQFITAL